VSEDSCLLRSDLGECQRCDLGYYLSDGECYPETITMLDLESINGSIPNCASYINQNFCGQCQTNYTQSSTGKCLLSSSLSISNCMIYSSTSTCQTCNNGYILQANQCVLCNVPGCLTCSSDNNCSQCANGFNPSTNTDTSIVTCVFVGWTSIYPCSQYSDPQPQGTCLKCAYPFNNAPLQDAPCSTCNINYCVACSTNGNLTTCSQCVDGYQPGIGNITCNLICKSPFCTNCTANLQCTQCISGYYPTDTVCAACTVQFCSVCSGNNTCTACIAGFYA
jgi:proprotein convertase subtilisin/kexin type 5